MPYDGDIRKFTETQNDVFSLEGLVAWLEKQPGEIEYTWHDCRGGCLVGRYLWDVLGKDAYYKTSKSFGEVFPGRGLNDYGYVAQTKPWTYAAALARAQKLLTGTHSPDSHTA